MSSRSTDDVAKIDADAKRDRPPGCDITLAHRALDRGGAFNRIDDAAEFDKRTIAHHFHDTPVAFGNRGIERLTPDALHGGNCARLIRLHHSAVSGDISGENGNKSPGDRLLSHAASLGEARGISTTHVEAGGTTAEVLTDRGWGHVQPAQS